MTERMGRAMPAERKQSEGGKTAPARTCFSLLDFEGFLRATGNVPLADLIREAFDREEALPEALHGKALGLFREYLLTGGMPGVVDVYGKTRSFEAAEKEKRRLLDGLLRELKGLPRSRADKTSKILREIPAQLAKSEKRFTLSALGKSARWRNCAEAFARLEDFGLLLPSLAAVPEEDRWVVEDSSVRKEYFVDMGLLGTLAVRTGLVTKAELTRGVLFGKFSFLNGMLVENAVAQTIARKGEQLLHFSQSGKKEGEERIEIDFLLIRPSPEAGGAPRVSPVEVKPSVRFRALSLERFAEKFGECVGAEYVVYPGPLRREGRRLLVPFYAAQCL